MEYKKDNLRAHLHKLSHRPGIHITFLDDRSTGPTYITCSGSTADMLIQRYMGHLVYYEEKRSKIDAVRNVTSYLPRVTYV